MPCLVLCQFFCHSSPHQALCAPRQCVQWSANQNLVDTCVAALQIIRACGVGSNGKIGGQNQALSRLHMQWSGVLGLTSIPGLSQERDWTQPPPDKKRGGGMKPCKRQRRTHCYPSVGWKEMTIGIQSTSMSDFSIGMRFGGRIAERISRTDPLQGNT